MAGPVTAENPDAPQRIEQLGDRPYARIAALPSYRVQTVAAGAGVVAYHDRGRVRLALGPPMGPVDAHERGIEEFFSNARENGRVPAMVPIDGNTVASVRAAGLRAVQIGREARMDLDGFKPTGRPYRSIRHSLNRMTQAGLRFELSAPPHADALLGALRQVSHDWLSSKRLPERRFGCGWFDPTYLQTTRIALMRDTRGRVEAFTNLLEGTTRTKPRSISCVTGRTLPGA